MLSFSHSLTNPFPSPPLSYYTPSPSLSLFSFYPSVSLPDEWRQKYSTVSITAQMHPLFHPLCIYSRAKYIKAESTQLRIVLSARHRRPPADLSTSTATIHRVTTPAVFHEPLILYPTAFSSCLARVLICPANKVARSTSLFRERERGKQKYLGFVINTEDFEDNLGRRTCDTKTN